MTTKATATAPRDTFEQEVRDATKLVTALKLLAWVGFGAAIVTVVAYGLKFSGPLSSETDTWGQFGDYVGGLLNPTFSFLAFVALLATLILQVRQLALSARESRESAKSFNEQISHLQKQTFEGTFFQTLRLHNDIVNGMEIPSMKLKGRACFLSIMEDLHHGSGLLRGDIHDIADFEEAYQEFYQEHQATLGHYFRLLYNLIKLVKNSAVPDKRFYTNLIRAQLSSAELELLFYNCLSGLGHEKFKPLVEEFALLKTFPDDNYPPEFLIRLYSPEAFGGNYPES